MPCDPAKPTAASLPNTWTQTIVIASHCVGLTLPGMIDEPGSFSGIAISPMPQRGPDASQRTSFAIFISAPASVRSAARDVDERVVRGQGGELVRRPTRNGWPVSRAILPRRGRAELGARSARCRPPCRRSRGRTARASRRRTSRGAWSICATQPPISWPSVIGVASCRWVRPILTTSANASAFAASVSRRRSTPGTSASSICSTDGDVHRGRERVVGRLAPVDVVVRVHRRLRPTLAAGELDRAVGDHLVGVHVDLRARPGLEHDEREVVVERRRRSPRRRRGTISSTFSGGSCPSSPFAMRRALLQDAERADHGTGEAEPVDADREVLDRPLGLRPPVTVGRHLDRPHRVGLGAKRGHGPEDMPMLRPVRQQRTRPI